MEQVFLAFAQDSKGRTVYETLVGQKFAGLLQEGGERKVINMEAS
jgi:hypothetical protein